MIHNVTKEEYLHNPCGTSATAFWKNSAFVKPDDVQVVHMRNYVPSLGDNPKHYFRLQHDLRHVCVPACRSYQISTVNIVTQKQIVSDVLQRCYGGSYPIETIDAWIGNRVFDNDLWILATDRHSAIPSALGIAEFDREIGEGSLEWIQVLPEHRRRGLGTLIVSELLARLAHRAAFATVSGACDREASAERLYRACGFTGNDIWTVTRTQPASLQKEGAP